MSDWKNSLQDTSFASYTLDRPIAEDAACVIFDAHTDDRWPMLIKLAPSAGSDAERQLEIWQRSRLLRHPHLLEIRDVGAAELAGDSYVYVVWEHPDEILATALENGPLSEAETRGVLEAALGALRYLHCQGLVHGAIDPNHIVAAGETVKLTTDALRELEHTDECAEDVRQLGELLRTLRAPEPLGEPLATVVQHATAADRAERWTLAEIARCIESAPVEPTPIDPTPVEPTPAVSVPAPPPVISSAAPEPVPEPVAPTPPPRPLPAQPSRPFPKWIIAALAVLLFVILWSHWRPKPEPPHVEIPPAAAPAAHPPAPQPVSAPALSRPGIWHVIAFTYRSHEQAVKKAHQINTRWPDLRAEVLAPRSLRGYYLVALGNGMTREDAVRLQRRARSLGLPHDTFVQNYATP